MGFTFNADLKWKGLDGGFGKLRWEVLGPRTTTKHRSSSSILNERLGNLLLSSSYERQSSRNVVAVFSGNVAGTFGASEAVPICESGRSWLPLSPSRFPRARSATLSQTQMPSIV